jgi:hypothetical protein
MRILNEIDLIFYFNCCRFFVVIVVVVVVFIINYNSCEYFMYTFKQ